jgi:hypothetical protein
MLREHASYYFRLYYCRFPIVITAIVFAFIGTFLNFLAVFLVIAGNGGSETAIMKFFVYAAYWPSLLVGVDVQDLFYPDLFMPICFNWAGWLLVSLIMTPFHRYICKRAA